ncbi:hypothetical protein, partial [Acinetobacter seifertii]|uniref:hypothetical protein n=1 Tax=Acinetobacter seifertii TaxID=1530123 RepID=UPI001D0E4A9A
YINNEKKHKINLRIIEYLKSFLSLKLTRKDDIFFAKIILQTELVKNKTPEISPPCSNVEIKNATVNTNNHSHD